MKYKLLFIQPCFKDFGGYFRSFTLANALVEKGHSVDLLISSRENSLRIKKYSSRKGLTLYELPRLNLHQFINGKILRGLLACLFILFKKYDLIHIFEAVQFETNLPLLLCKLLNRKTVLDIDEDWLDSPIYHQSSPLIKKYLRYCDLTLTPKSKYLTVTSDYLVDKFTKLGAPHVLKIINGVDHDQFQTISRAKAREHLGISPSAKIILSFGNTYEDERAYLLLKTFEEVYKLDKTVKLYFNFNPEHFFYMDKIKNTINQKIFKNIITTGFIKQGMLPYYLGSCDLVLFLMGSSPAEAACFPIRIGSYLNGERVIATNQNQTEAYRTLQKYQCALVGKNPVEIAKKMMQFFRDESLRRQLEANVKIAKNKLDINYLINDLIDFYAKVI